MVDPPLNIANVENGNACMLRGIGDKMTTFEDVFEEEMNSHFAETNIKKVHQGLPYRQIT